MSRVPLIQLLNPIYWIIAGFHAVYRWQMWYPGDVISQFFFIASSTLAFANILFIATNLLAAFKVRSLSLGAAALLSPIYWILISIGSWKGMLQLGTKAHYWEKTVHGEKQLVARGHQSEQPS